MQASAAATQGFSCPVARGIFPEQGSNWCRLHRQAGSYPPDHQGSPERV